MPNQQDETFAPAGVEWTRVSPSLTSARRTTWTLTCAAVVVIVIVGFFVPRIPIWAPAVVLILVLSVYVWGLWYFARRTASWGYAERDDDLIVTRGFMFRKLVIVPYGRMQLVDVSAGPIDRKFNIARLQLHTAAATTDASIPGLPPEVSSAMRDRLSRLAEERAAGL